MMESEFIEGWSMNSLEQVLILREKILSLKINIKFMDVVLIKF